MALGKAGRKSKLPFGPFMLAGTLTAVLFGAVLKLYTASRGGLIGLVTFLALFLCLRVRGVGKAFKITMLAAVVIAGIANAEKINIDRYMTLGSIEEDYNFQEGGRTDIWKRGVTLFLAHPLTGVGVDGFPKAIGDMRAAENGTLPLWQTAHNAYMLVLTETGIAGLVPFLLLIVTCLSTFNRLRRSSASIQDRDLAALPALLLAGFIAQLVANGRRSCRRPIALGEHRIDTGQYMRCAFRQQFGGRHVL